MKIIISRKGFDSSSGGCPNPILPDGRLMPLPIPDPHSPIRYEHITDNGINLGELVSAITHNRVASQHGAHLDPDLKAESYPRHSQWQPILGQHGSAQGHLANQGVGIGDLFLFFGLFLPVVKTANGWQFDKQQAPKHCFWGYLQVGHVLATDSLSDEQRQWAGYHPHCFLPAEKNNCLYIAKRTLFDSTSIKGADTFKLATKQQLLTAPDARTPSQWRVPAWMYPSEGKTPLSYHHKRDRWQTPLPGKRHIQLQGVARGQEFVLDTKHYPYAKRWAQQLIKTGLSRH